MRRWLSAGVAVVMLIASATACSDSPTSPTSEEDESVSTPVSVSFPWAVGPGGTASRTFTARMPGTAQATVTGIAPSAELIVGLGIPRTGGSGCLLARAATAGDGVSAQVSARVDGGTFCVQVLGPATAPGTVVFTVTLEHP